MLTSRPLVAVWAAFLVGGALAATLQERDPRREATVTGAETPASPLVTLPIGRPRGATAIGDPVLIAADRYGLDPALVMAIIQAESRYDSTAVSHKGAIGLMQVMPETALWLGVPDPADPATNLDAGCRYFSYLLQSFGGDIVLALAAYNAGPATVRRWGTVPPYRETRTFVRRVDTAYRELTGLGLIEANRLVS